MGFGDSFPSDTKDDTNCALFFFIFSKSKRPKGVDTAAAPPALDNLPGTGQRKLGGVSNFGRLGPLCRDLCRNPAIPAGLWPCRRVSLDDRRSALNMRRTIMNTAVRCRLLSLAIRAPLFVEGNGMEEVVGSIPTRSTKFPNNLDRANAWGGGQDRSCSRHRLFPSVFDVTPTIL